MIKIHPGRRIAERIKGALYKLDGLSFEGMEPKVGENSAFTFRVVYRDQNGMHIVAGGSGDRWGDAIERCVTLIEREAVNGLPPNWKESAP